MIKKYGSKTKAKKGIDNKNWTAQIKIEELFILGVLTVSESLVTNDLRKKRNHLFHYDIKNDK